MDQVKTPKHLWIVGILALLWNAMGAVDYVMTETRNASYMSQYSPEQLEYFTNFPVWFIAFWAIAVWGSVLGSILLLLRIRWAGAAFFVSLLAMVVTSVYSFGMSDGASIMGVGGIVFTVVIYLVAVFLLLYSRAMCKRGVTR